MYGLMTPMLGATVPRPPACFPTLHLAPSVMPTLPTNLVRLSFGKDPDIQFAGFFQMGPQVQTVPPYPMQLPTEQAVKPMVPPPSLAADSTIDPTTQTLMPLTIEEAVGPVSEHQSSSWYKSGEDMEEGDEGEHSG